MLDSLSQAYHDNQLLAAMPREAFDLMARELRQVAFEAWTADLRGGCSIDQIYFPQSDMISLLIEDAVGLHAALGKRLAFTHATTQVTGMFSTIHPNILAQFVQNYQSVRDLIGQYTEVLWAKAQQIGCLSFPKIPSDLDSRDGAESSHHETGCLQSFMSLEWFSPTWSSRLPDLKPRYCFFGISCTSHCGTHRRGFDCTVVIAPSWFG